MDTKRLDALYLASELREGKWTPNILQNESALRDRAAEELERLHARIAELETRLEVDARHPYDGIACRDATIAELQAGYDAARLEIESLQLRDAERHGDYSAALLEIASLKRCDQPAAPAKADEYPPLPDCKYTQSGDIKDFGLYSTAQMLAYVAADRAARPPAPVASEAQPVAAPAGMEPVYQIGQPFLFDPENTWRDASKDAYDMHMPNRRRIIYTAAQVQAMLAAAPSGPAREPLTEEQIAEIWQIVWDDSPDKGFGLMFKLARAIEYAHRIE